MMQMVVGINAKQHAQPMRMANGAQNKVLMDVKKAGATLEVSSLFYDYLINTFHKYVYSLYLEFCPADCNWEKQQVCPGKMDPKTGDQISADYCFSKEDGFGCTIHCSMNCGEKETLCPGKVDSDGCKEPDYCYPGSK